MLLGREEVVWSTRQGAGTGLLEQREDYEQAGDGSLQGENADEQKSSLLKQTSFLLFTIHWRPSLQDKIAKSSVVLIVGHVMKPFANHPVTNITGSNSDSIRPSI